MTSRFRDVAIVIILIILAGLFAFQWPTFRLDLTKWVPPIALFLQIYTVVLYSAIGSKFILESELIHGYDPSGGLAQIVGWFVGPLGGLITEPIQYVVFFQITKVLFQGITLREWSHGLSIGNYLLITLVLIVVFGLVLFHIIILTVKTAHYWSSNIGEVVPVDTDEFEIN